MRIRAYLGRSPFQVKAGLFTLLLLTVWLAPAAEYQFSVACASADGTQSSRAWLWIPPECRRVRGLIVGGQVILEKLMLDDPLIRQAAADENLGLVILFPNPLGEFDYHAGADKALEKILKELSEESGYTEIAGAPLMTIGHSSGALLAWNVAYWKPARVMGIVTLHAAAILPPHWNPRATPDGIPVLAVSGEYETWDKPGLPLDKHWKLLRGGLLNMRSRFDEALVSEVVQPRASHFSWDEALSRHVAMFIQKVVQRRLPAEATIGTKPVELTHLQLESGWLTDVTLLTPSRYAPAPYRRFQGDPTLAFWHMDEEAALAAESYGAEHKGKLDQRVTFVQGGKPVPPGWLPDLKFDPIDDGMTVKVAGTFLSRTPEGPAGADRPLGQADGPIRFRLIGGRGGGGQQTGPDTFRIHFDHFGINRRTCALQIMAYHEGDARYAYAEQPCQIVFPEKNTNGRPQKINFPRIPDQPRSAQSVELHATADSGLPVEYFVRQGPAELEGTRLKFTPIPPRAKFPIKVTVTAYQWGRPLEPLVQSAQPVEQTFLLQP